MPIIQPGVHQHALRGMVFISPWHHSPTLYCLLYLPGDVLIFLASKRTDQSKILKKITYPRILFGKVPHVFAFLCERIIQRRTNKSPLLFISDNSRWYVKTYPRQARPERSSELGVQLPGLALQYSSTKEATARDKQEVWVYTCSLGVVQT